MRDSNERDRLSIRRFYKGMLGTSNRVIVTPVVLNGDCDRFNGRGGNLRLKAWQPKTKLLGKILRGF